MSDHEFEKQVQLKMEQLRLRPSNAVWTEVEKNIRRDKRRRRMIMWLPIALLFLGAGGYFAMKETSGPAKHLVSQATPSSSTTTSSTQNDQPSTSSSTQQAQENTLPATTPAANTAVAPGEPTSSTPVSIDKVSTDKATAASTPATTKPIIGKTTPAVAPANSKTPAIVTVVPNDTKATTKKVTGNTPAAIVVKRIKEDNNSNPDYTTSSVRPGKKRSGKAKQDNDNDLAVNKPVSTKPQPVEDKQPPVLQQDSSVVIIANSDSAQTVQDVVTVEPTVTIVDSSSLAQATPVDSVAKDSAQTIAAVPPAATPEVAKVQPVQKKAGPSRWQFGVQAEGGYSGVTDDGLLGFLEKNYTAVPDLASPSFNNSLTFAPQFPRPVSKPSNLTMGLSFSVGGFVKRALSNRLSLSAGLQYTYLSTRQVVGSKMHNNRTVNRAPSTSQIVTEYYDANTTYTNINNPNKSTQNYTNRYQFIELPVTLHTQLNRGKRLPIIWDAGFSVSKLLGTNALHYDGLGGVYYKDNTLFNKTQWAVSTGFNVQLFKLSQYPLTVGPVMRYNITPMLKKDFSTGQHIWAVGLRASVLLKK